MAVENEKRPRELEKINVARVRLAPLDADPTDLEDGDIWYHGPSDTIKCRLNGVTKTITAA